LDIRAEASGNPHAEEVSRMFQVVDEAFNMAARGASTISFDREVGRSMRVLRILVTGFDPFSDSGDTAPRAGDWNPSGAAALALDGSRVAIRRGVIAAVEAVVLPVSFNEFRSGGTEGIVEQIVRPQAGTVDAVITVSMDPNMTTDAPIRLEQFAVGVSGLDTLTPHRMLPAERPRRRGLEATPGHETDPAIVESTADVERIRSDMAGRTGDDVPTPTVGTAITLRFANLTAANQALTALGLPETRSPQVEIADADAVRRILEHMERDAAHPTRINFSLGSQRFSAEVIEGPGGNFLSNEVSYRTLRVLEEEGSDAMSLHVHTPDAPHVPQPSEAGYTRAGRRRAEAEAEHTRSQVITALRQVIQSVGAQILERTPATTP
jgi:pyrrolidone-carboxylate peptidase